MCFVDEYHALHYYFAMLHLVVYDNTKSKIELLTNGWLTLVNLFLADILKFIQWVDPERLVYSVPLPRLTDEIIFFQASRAIPRLADQHRGSL